MYIDLTRHEAIMTWYWRGNDVFLFQDECKLELATNGKHLARCDVVNFNWEIEG